AEIAAFAEVRDNRLTIALLFSVFAGMAIPFFTNFPLAFTLLVFAGLIACAIARPNEPLLENIRARHLWAEEAAQRLQKRYDHEPENERWRAKRDELRNQKETYENLAQIRRSRLQELEAEASKHQLEEFLDQFEINDAEIKGIVPAAKKILL